MLALLLVNTYDFRFVGAACVAVVLGRVADRFTNIRHKRHALTNLNIIELAMYVIMHHMC